MMIGPILPRFRSSIPGRRVTERMVISEEDFRSWPKPLRYCCVCGKQLKVRDEIYLVEDRAMVERAERLGLVDLVEHAWKSLSRPVEFCIHARCLNSPLMRP